MKICNKCNIEKPLTEFHSSKLKYKANDGKRPTCKLCRRMYDPKWWQQNREKACEISKKWQRRNPDATKRNSKNQNLKWNYGITLDHFNKMCLEQGDTCAICKKDNSQFTKTLFVDHCHKTGKIRGLLCKKCNSGLGFLGETVEDLERAIEYLKKYL